MSYTPKSEREKPDELKDEEDVELSSTADNIENLEKELQHDDTDYDKFTHKMISELENL